jgi:DNA invertase Pin-like site-specific DNA recombinase
MAAEPGPDFRWGLVTRRSAYNRRTTDSGEVERYEQSTSRQEHALHGHIQANSMGLVVAVYTDIASAYDEEAARPEFENALLDLQAGRIDGLAAWRPDRLVRRTRQLRRVLSIVEDAGGRLLFLTPAVIDTADTANRAFTGLFLDLLVAFAEMESESIGDRIALMHQDRARKGLVQSPGRPFGHSEDWHSLVLPEVKVLHEAGERILTDEASNSIARDLTSRGILTSRGNTRWHAERLRAMLLSPRMVGKRLYGGEMYDLDGVPPIFDEETWQRICDKLKQRSKPSGPTTKRLLSAIVLCGICGRTLTSAIPRTDRFAYECKPRYVGDGACRKISVLGTRADEVVRGKVVDFLADHQRVNALLAERTKGPGTEAVHSRINELSESLLTLAKALNPPPGVPRMPLPVYYEQVSAIETEREQLHRRLAVTREAGMLAEALTFSDAAKEWDSRPLHWQRAILKLVTKRIVVEPRGKASPRPGFNVFDPERIRVEFAA